ncbi:MAG: hypothetical protein AAF542_06280 [Pseudomonadota bacterium]
MRSLQRSAGIAAISEACIYILAFIYFGAYWSYPVDGSEIDKMNYLAENQIAFSMISFLMYIVFGVLLAVLVTGLHIRLKCSQNSLLALASVFGVIWAGLVISSGMLSNIGLMHAIDQLGESPELAFDLWIIVSVLTESLGGGNELLGGLWVLLFSVAARQERWLPRSLNYYGCFVGLAGIATVYPHELATDIFGVSQIVWFMWLGVCLLSEKHAVLAAEVR